MATHYTPDRAEQIAAEMQANDEDGWTYHARHDPQGSGYSLIDICDEDGVLVGTLGD